MLSAHTATPQDCPDCQARGRFTNPDGTLRLCKRCGGVGHIGLAARRKTLGHARRLLIACAFLVTFAAGAGVGDLFGHDTAHAAMSAPLLPMSTLNEGICAPTPTPIPPLFDPLNNFALVYAHSPSWYFDTSNPAFFGGDASRAVRYPATPTSPLSAEWLVYQAPHANTITARLWHEADQGMVTLDLGWSDGTTSPSGAATLAWHLTRDAFTDSNFHVITNGWGYVDVTLVTHDYHARFALIQFDKTSTDGAQWANQIGQVTIGF